jgi:hypothetical protein
VKAALRSTDHVFVESVRLALEAEGITVIREQASAAAMPFIPMTLLVADHDFDHAEQIIRELRPTHLNIVEHERPALRPWRIAFIALLVLTILLLLRASASGMLRQLGL